MEAKGNYSGSKFHGSRLPWRDGMWICNCYADHERPTFHYRIFVCQVWARGSEVCGLTVILIEMESNED